jgi:hypothetical protein
MDWRFFFWIFLLLIYLDIAYKTRKTPYLEQERESDFLKSHYCFQKGRSYLFNRIHRKRNTRSQPKVIIVGYFVFNNFSKMIFPATATS